MYLRFLSRRDLVQYHKKDELQKTSPVPKKLIGKEYSL